MLPLGLVLALALTKPASGAEPEPRPPHPVAIKGQFRLRAETSERTDLTTTRNYFYLRMRPGFEFRADSPMTFFFEPQIARAFGEPSATNQSQSGATIDPSISIHQAYASYHSSESHLTATAGRQILSYGDELVIGALEWNNVGRSFDAIKLRSEYNLGASDLFVSKIVDETFNRSLSDKTFFGLYNAWSFGPGAKEVDLYALYLQSEGAVQDPRSSLWTSGVRLKSSLGPLDYRAEMTFKHDTSRDTDAYQWDSALGIAILSASKLRIGLGAFQASKNYNQLFPTAHKWLGYADIFGRRNISGGSLSASVYPTERLKLQAEALRFFRTSEEATAFQLNGTTPLGTTTDSESRTLGTELDLTASYELGVVGKLTAGFSTLYPGAYLSDQFGGRNPLFYYLQLETPF